MTKATYTIHGTTDEVTVCDCCGKKNLNVTVCLEVVEGENAGDILHFGSHCAARALCQRGKSNVIVDKAKRLQRLRPIEAVVRSALSQGIPAAVSAGKVAAAALSKDISVSGYDSWGCINIDAPGARIQVAA